METGLQVLMLFGRRFNVVLMGRESGVGAAERPLKY